MKKNIRKKGIANVPSPEIRDQHRAPPMVLFTNSITLTYFFTLHPQSSLKSSPHVTSSRRKHPSICTRTNSTKIRRRIFTVFQKLNAGADDFGEESVAATNMAEKMQKRLSEQSSWETKDTKGNDYLYRLGAEADNMNIAVGARAGVVDDLFVGSFLGHDSDIVFDYRRKVTRSFEYLQGDYYISPVFMSGIITFSIEEVLSRFYIGDSYII
ncbi:hypothetical protein Dimus_003596 [Dionaea muscipula]